MSPPRIDLQAIPGPIILAGDERTAYRTLWSPGARGHASMARSGSRAVSLGCDLRIACAAESLIENRHRVVPCLTEQVHQLRGEILIQLEPQSGDPIRSRTTRVPWPGRQRSLLLPELIRE